MDSVESTRFLPTDIHTLMELSKAHVVSFCEEARGTPTEGIIMMYCIMTIQKEVPINLQSVRHFRGGSEGM
jgi:hypothetical protein